MLGLVTASVGGSPVLDLVPSDWGGSRGVDVPGARGTDARGRSARLGRSSFFAGEPGRSPEGSGSLAFGGGVTSR